MKTKIIIMCAGQQKRWDSEVPKHLSPIQGVRNIIRTVKMLHTMGVPPEDVYVTVNHNNMSYFTGDKLNLVVGSSFREIDRFRNGFQVIENADRSIFLYGDVAYFNTDIELILKGQEYAFYGHKKGNKLTGKSYKEIFGVVVMDANEFKNEVREVAAKFENKQLWRETAWEVYDNRQMRRGEKNPTAFVELTEMTDDFDSREEYENVRKLYEL